jgi:hypothetical protein
MGYPTDADPRVGTDADWRGEKRRQYPCGLIVPSTILQLLGGTNCAHLLHCLSPFGLSW